MLVIFHHDIDASLKLIFCPAGNKAGTIIGELIGTGPGVNVYFTALNHGLLRNRRDTTDTGYKDGRADDRPFADAGSKGGRLRRLAVDTGDRLSFGEIAVKHFAALFVKAVEGHLWKQDTLGYDIESCGHVR